MAHFFLVEIGVGERRVLIFVVYRESFHKPIRLTGIFYSVNPLSYSERIKEVPQTRKIDLVEQQNLAIPGAATLPTAEQVSLPATKDPLFTSDPSPDPVERPC